MTKAPAPTAKSKKQRDNTKTPPKPSITQRLRTNLERCSIIIVLHFGDYRCLPPTLNNSLYLCFGAHEPKVQVHFVLGLSVAGCSSDIYSETTEQI